VPNIEVLVVEVDFVAINGMTKIVIIAIICAASLNEILVFIFLKSKITHNGLNKRRFNGVYFLWW